MKGKIIILLLSIFIISPASGSEYGLYISGNSDNPTTLLPDNGNPIRLRDELTISFRFHIDDITPGSIMKIISNRNELFAIDLLPDDNGVSLPAFIVNDRIYFFPVADVSDGWLSAAITLSPLNKLITISLEGKQKHLPYTFEKRTYLRIAFGYCPFEGYESAGTAAITLRDIRMLQNGSPLRYWQLEAHADTLCYDSVAYMPARITNPDWVVNNGHAVAPVAYQQAGPDDIHGYAVIWKMLLFVGGVFVLTAAVMQFLYIRNRKSR